MKKKNLSSLLVLNALDTEGLTQSKIMTDTGISQSGISKVIKNLMDSDLVQRKMVAGRVGNVYSLTELGVQARKNIGKADLYVQAGNFLSRPLEDHRVVNYQRSFRYLDKPDF